MIQGAFRAQEVNPAKLAQLYRRELQLCELRKGETDVPMRDCTVALDGRVVIERGKIVDEPMRVKREAR
jgi:hypothetical protein